MPRVLAENNTENENNSLKNANNFFKNFKWGDFKNDGIIIVKKYQEYDSYIVVDI